MVRLVKFIFGLFFRSFHACRDLLLENLALRQQLAVLARRRPQPRFSNGDRFLWITLRRLWSGWRKALILVQPDTVVRWHRAGFKLYCIIAISSPPERAVGSALSRNGRCSSKRPDLPS